MKVLITGAAGNLGGALAHYLLDTSDLILHLLVHKKDVCSCLKLSPRTKIFRGDLAHKNSLHTCLEEVDVIIYFAGVLFKGRPETFLAKTNVGYFRNLCDMALEFPIKRIILISFPHVEGNSTPDHPAKGSLCKKPISVHAQTRLDEEKYLFAVTSNSTIEPVSLRLGMVYGKGVLMIEAARLLAKWRMLGVWKEKTWIHLISMDDFLESAKNAIIRENIRGIYHIGDEGRQTLQEFMDIATSTWNCKKPWIMPVWVINLAATICEVQSSIFGTIAPLTRDFIRIGRVSYYGDTSKMRAELLGDLKYKTIQEGKCIL
ncbi:MAG: NAD(P)-dependent oxidoreductase [Sedimentisphaerales bacterium]|nr:NAD(P)-dependent oxidoreductase [Sedimentisphaerales bacterium]